MRKRENGVWASVNVGDVAERGARFAFLAYFNV